MAYEKLMELRNDKSEFAIQLGLKTLEIREGYAKAELVIDKRHLNSLGTVHGGCIFSIADTNGATAAMTCGSYVTTISGDIHFLRAAKGMEKLVVIARVSRAGRRIMVYDLEVSDEKDHLIAKGLFSYYNLKRPLD